MQERMGDGTRPLTLWWMIYASLPLDYISLEVTTQIFSTSLRRSSSRETKLSGYQAQECEKGYIGQTKVGRPLDLGQEICPIFIAIQHIDAKLKTRPGRFIKLHFLFFLLSVEAGFVQRCRQTWRQRYSRWGA